jgi:hypothetical protein
MRSEIREPDEWPWHIYEETFEGMTLKHVFDHIMMFTRVKHEQECPTPFCEPAWNSFHDRGQNFEIKYTPMYGPKIPDQWRNWRKQTTAKDFEQFPSSVEFDADIIHKAFDPIPLQPAQTENKCSYKTWFISPAKTVSIMVSVGRNYTFCDRFNPEQIITLTQTVKPGAMNEPDPAKRLAMFSTHIEIKGRIHVLKNLAFARSKILQ